MSIANVLREVSSIIRVTACSAVFPCSSSSLASSAHHTPAVTPALQRDSTSLVVPASLLSMPAADLTQSMASSELSPFSKSSGTTTPTKQVPSMFSQLTHGWISRNNLVPSLPAAFRISASPPG